MARSYAGILGLLAMMVVSVRSLIRGFTADEALISTMLALAVFTTVGLVIGKLADNVVLESVWTKVRSELGAMDKESPDAQKQ